MSAGMIVNVQEVVGGSELAADVSAGASSITVEDPTDFNPDGGDLLIGAEEKSYSAVNEDTGAITLDSTLASSYLTEERVIALPAYTERFAHVLLEEQDETLQARVPHALYDRLGVGTRDVNLDEGELVELERDPSGELIVADIVDRPPLTDASFIDPDTTGNLPGGTDGLAPSVSPTPIVDGGVGFLAVRWTAVSNPDLVTYEVHVSTSSGFTPGPATLAAELVGTLIFLRKQPNGSDFAYGTTYFVRLIAKDDDGAAAPGAEDSAQVVKIEYDKVASDGGTPAAPGAPTVAGGPGFIQATWAQPSGTTDPLFYKVYVSASSGFTPDDGTNLVATTPALKLVIDQLTGGGQLATGTTYFVKVKAVSALSGNISAASGQGSGTPDVIDASVTTLSNLNAGTITAGTLDAARIGANSITAAKIAANTLTAAEIAAGAITADELAANAVIAAKILAGEILAEHLSSVLVLASTIMAGTVDAGRVELGVGTMEGMLGIHAYAPDGQTVTFMVDAESGLVHVTGHFSFGTGSQLMNTDVIELQRQPIGSFETPLLTQAAGGRTPSGGATTVSASWPQMTENGATLIATLFVTDTDGTPPTPTTPSGWTQVANVTRADSRLLVYKIEAATPRIGAQSFTLGDTVYASLQLFEYAGVGVQDVAVVTANGSSTSPSVGPSATTTQAEELWLAVMATYDYPSPPTDFGPSDFTSITNSFLAVRSEYAPATNPGQFPSTRQTVMAKNVTATGTASVAATIDAADNWMAALITFKAKAAGVEAPPSQKLRLYGRNAGGEAFLHTKNDQDVEGAVVLGTAGEVWRLEVVTASVNFADLAGHSGTAVTVSLAGVAVGDLVFYLGQDGSDQNARVNTVRGNVATTAGQITLQTYNADSANSNPGASTLTFLVIHKGSP